MKLNAQISKINKYETYHIDEHSYSVSIWQYNL